jgi:hypothetical protein
MMLALVSILAAALLFTVGDACEGVPSMSIDGMPLSGEHG